MDCRDVRSLLAVYLDGELEEPGRAQVEAHLQTCEACAARLADYRQLGHEIRALPRVAPPAELRTGVLAQVAAGRRRWSERGGSLGRVGSALLLAAALLLLAVGLASLLRGFQDGGAGPAVWSASPATGATGVSIRSRLEITFDRPMDRESVTAAIQVEPAIELAYAWQAETLTVVPVRDWAPDATYTLTVGVAARDERGRRLARPFVLTFATAGTGGSLNPIGRFGHVWRAAFDGPAGELGFATAPARDTWSAWQPFERGLMFWQDNPDEDFILVLFYAADADHGTWRRCTDTWREGDPERAGYTPPADLWEPIRGFGRVWRDELDGGPGGSAVIGWAVVPEQGFVGTWQLFEHGLMLWNPVDAQVYALLDDGSWERFPDPWSP
jgi:hypothetical protein